jgi:FKBP-type peptidyl-prolyl cis-trans isomerase SlyD
MKIEQGKKIKMEYEIGIEGGETIESSADRGPLEFIHGTGAMPPALEEALEGMAQGDKKEGVIPAVPPKTLKRTDFPEGEEIEEGKVFEAKGPDGNPIKFTVLSIDDDDVQVQFEAPGAGKDLRFKVKILDVSDPN